MPCYGQGHLPLDQTFIVDKKVQLQVCEDQNGDRSHLAGAVTAAALTPLPCPAQNRLFLIHWNWQQFPFSLCRSQPPAHSASSSVSPNKMPGGGKQSTPKKSSRKLFFKLLVQIPAGSAVDLKLDQVTSRQLCELQEKIT